MPIFAALAKTFACNLAIYAAESGGLMARIAEIRRTAIPKPAMILAGRGLAGFALTHRDTNETIGVAVSYPSQLTSTQERAKLWQALRAMAIDLGRLFDDRYGWRWMTAHHDARPRHDERGPHGITPVAWLIAPSALLFALFFFLPMGLMALISLLTGNPVVHQMSISRPILPTDFSVTLLFRGDLDHATDWSAHHAGGVADRLSAGPLDGAHSWSHSLCMLMMTVLTPMLTGIVVRTFAWMALLSDKGAINQALVGLGLISKPLPLMYNEFSIVLVSRILRAYMVLTLVGVIGRIDERLEHARRILAPRLSGLP